MLYSITDWYENVHHMTAPQLYLRIMQDSKSDYNWIASATELVRVCKLPNFPSFYARKIKIAILNCFANLELKKHIPSHQNATDTEAVCYCYNSLSDTNVNSFEAKKKYLKAIITGVTLYHFDILDKLLLPAGPSYQKKCNEWIEEQFNKNIVRKEINFEQFIKELHNDFDKTIKKAEEAGMFDEDRKKHAEEMATIAKRIVEAGNI